MNTTRQSCDTTKRGVVEYNISVEDFEKVMDKHAGYIMSQTLMTKSTLYFPDGRVVEYTYDEKNNRVHKKEERVKANETD